MEIKLTQNNEDIGGVTEIKVCDFDITKELREKAINAIKDNIYVADVIL